MAYILGFCVADGSIRHKDFCKYGGYALAVQIHTKDRKIIEFIHTELNCQSKIYDTIYNGSDGITREQSSIVVNSKILVEDLMELGVIPQKTGKEIIPPGLPLEFFPDFFRGYFDGDGCIIIGTQICNGKEYGMYSCNLTCANKEFLQNIKEKFPNYKNNVVGHGSGCFRWDVRSKKNIIEIGKMMYYDGHTFALERKRTKFYQLMGI